MTKENRKLEIRPHMRGQFAKSVDEFRKLLTEWRDKFQDYNPNVQYVKLSIQSTKHVVTQLSDVIVVQFPVI